VAGFTGQRTLPIVIRERGKNNFGGPDVAAIDAEHTRTTMFDPVQTAYEAPVIFRQFAPNRQSNPGAAGLSTHSKTGAIP
jgi:hypothetical protein